MIEAVFEKTEDATLARVIDYTLAIKKYPIVVHLGRGFFSTRVFSAQLLEAINMVAESIDPAIIEQAALQAGYAVEAAQKEGADLDKSVPIAGQVIAKMMDQFERTGKQGDAGFYNYADGKRTRLWSGVRQEWQSSPELSAPFEDLEDRLMFIQVIETQNAFDEGVIDSDPDANIGSIFGISFPPWTGGVRQFVKGDPGAGMRFCSGPITWRPRTAVDSRCPPACEGDRTHNHSSLLDAVARSDKWLSKGRCRRAARSMSAMVILWTM